jgi:hypothetical protein
MKKLLLRRSEEYKRRITYYKNNVRTRYGAHVSNAFVDCVKKAEAHLAEYSVAYSEAPYVICGQITLLREYFFSSGAVDYCMIYFVCEQENRIELVTFWHVIGSRHVGNVYRIWPKHQ